MGHPGLGVARIPRLELACMGWSQCQSDPPLDMVAEHPLLVFHLSRALCFGDRAQTLWAVASPTENLVSCDVSPPPWISLSGRLSDLEGTGELR